MSKGLKQNIHFMGIGGSGMSAAAILAHYQGYKVSGCDLAESTPYFGSLKKLNIPIYVGHDVDHLNNIDLLVVTPAIYFQSKKHPEVIAGKKKKMMTWQQFLGSHLQRNKRVICVSGTHGKSTTTALAARVFEEASLDPWVVVGATVNKWRSNCRVGKSNLFIIESDEFYDNFLSYTPETIILNNIELDHPDYFKNMSQVFASFKAHIESLIGPKNLIYNKDCPGIKKLLRMIDKKTFSELNMVGYTLRQKSIKLEKNFTSFTTNGEKFKTKLPGKYNVSNILGVICLSRLYNVPDRVLRKVIWGFSGIGRRMDLIGENKGIAVYDDYAHHPTAIKATLAALKQKHPMARIWAIIEPHTYSRTKALLDLYKNCFEEASEVIIGPLFKSRDKKTFGVTGQSIVDVTDHGSMIYLDSFKKIIEFYKKKSQKGDVVIVMGAGDSYKLARDIFKSI